MLKKKYKSINELINALTSTDEVYRRNAIHNLVRIGEPAVLPLINSLKDENFFVRSQVIIALGMIGDSLAVEPLINSLKDDNAKVRENTVIALGNFSNARIVEPLVNLLKDENPQVRENTSRILHKIGKKPRSIKSAQSFNKKIEYGCEICSNSAEYILFLKSKKTIDMYYYLVCRVCNERIIGKEEEIDPEKINLKDVDVALKYKGKKKDIFLVQNSFRAIITARKHDYDYLHGYNQLFEDQKKLGKLELTNLTGTGPILVRILRYCKNINDDGNYLISEKLIKNLHKLLAEDMDNNENGAPGEYRPEPAHINFKTVFMEPSLIKKSMQKLIQDYQKRFKKISQNPFIEACKFTGDFIIIHPFGDFNGRIARILLNMILQLEFFPLYIILRSNARDKKKYITSMKHYYQGRPNTYLALVCKVFIEEIESINSRLKMADMEPINPVQLTDEQMKLLEEDLIEYEKSTSKF